MKDLKEIFEKLKNDEKFRSAFKEDSVREELLKPLLDKLGFVNMGLSGGGGGKPRSFKKSNSTKAHNHRLKF
ncbi:hypothetical protein [Campylobacter upsaliensis]|uniref:hypothetical protein n=2 Tax=Campylobacter upsaliensis TaxID=28080 RepID=UPI0022EA380E|nr:hypothetical protein [Campylobacter upsaliensis]